MQITVTGRHIDVGQALRQHAEEELESTVAKYFDNAIDGGVTFTRTGAFLHVEIAVHVGRGIMVQSNAQGDDPYQVLAAALAKVGKRLRRYKRRLRDHHQQAQIRDIEKTWAQQYILAHEDEAAAEENEAEAADGEPAIIAEMTTEIPSLSVSEAVMRMDLTDMPAFLFRNRAHGGLNMVYRRPDGNIGWVDPRGSK